MNAKLATLALAAAAAAIPVGGSAQSVAAVKTATDSQSFAASGLQPRIAPAEKRYSPYAYGYINMNGSTSSGSGNFHSSYYAPYGWYYIHITGVNYYFNRFSTVVTPSLPRNAFCDGDSIGGNLLVVCTDPAGNPTAAEFSFVTF